MVTLLQSAYNDFSCLPEYLDALSIAGVDGTLKTRLQKTPLARFVRAKTGTMSGITCIAGYMQTRKGTMIAFSIMMNGFVGSSQPFRKLQDEILSTLWEKY
jgi:D-alanyl-D-alanine carboxypeptidase/D-alanyl-D-alanine-endopeptidase (penicillin-binding protein 4)